MTFYTLTLEIIPLVRTDLDHFFITKVGFFDRRGQKTRGFDFFVVRPILGRTVLLFVGIPNWSLKVKWGRSEHDLDPGVEMGHSRMDPGLWDIDEQGSIRVQYG